MSSGQETQHRHSVITELIVTEENYNNDLDVIKRVFLDPLKEQQLLSKEEIFNLFANIEAIIDLNKGFLKELKNLQQQDPTFPLIGPLLLDWIGKFGVYLPYCSNCGHHAERLLQYKALHPEFAKFTERCFVHPDCRLLYIDSFLVAPLQRLCKYPLLFKELAKHTPEGHADFEAVKSASQEMTNLVVTINERAKQVENIDKMIDINDKLEFKYGEELDLVSPKRKFLREGVFLVSSQKKNLKETQVYLFNDMILLTKKKHRDRGSGYQVLVRIPLDSVAAVQTTPQDSSSSTAPESAARENCCCFDVVCYSGGECSVYTFEAQAAQSAEEVKLWTADIARLSIPDVTNAAMTNGQSLSGGHNMKKVANSKLTIATTTQFTIRKSNAIMRGLSFLGGRSVAEDSSSSSTSTATNSTRCSPLSSSSSALPTPPPPSSPPTLPFPIRPRSAGYSALEMDGSSSSGAYQDYPTRSHRLDKKQQLIGSANPAGGSPVATAMDKQSPSDHESSNNTLSLRITSPRSPRTSSSPSSSSSPTSGLPPISPRRLRSSASEQQQQQEQHCESSLPTSPRRLRSSASEQQQQHEHLRESLQSEKQLRAEAQEKIERLQEKLHSLKKKYRSLKERTHHLDRNKRKSMPLTYEDKRELELVRAQVKELRAQRRERERELNYQREENRRLRLQVQVLEQKNELHHQLLILYTEKLNAVAPGSNNAAAALLSSLIDDSRRPSTSSISSSSSSFSTTYASFSTPAYNATSAPAQYASGGLYGSQPATSSAKDTSSSPTLRRRQSSGPSSLLPRLTTQLSTGSLLGGDSSSL